MELAKVSAKALHNISGDSNHWSMDQIKKLDEILGSLGEELDSIMVRNHIVCHCKLTLFLGCGQRR